MTMSSSVERLSGLKRRLTITISAEEVAELYKKHADKLAKTVKLPGFRPGKVPARVVEQRFGHHLRADVAKELVQLHLPSAMIQENLQPVSQPQVDIPTLDDFKLDEALSFSADCEVYPEVAIADLSTVKLERQVVAVHEADIDAVILKIRKQQATKEPVERAAAKGDYVKINFEGFCEGKPFKGNAATDFELELGAGRMIPGFEEGIMGAAVGEERDVQCEFPKDYHSNKELAGKKATFKVKINQVLAAILPEVDDEFVKNMGIEQGGVTAMREQIKENLTKRATLFLQAQMRVAAMDKVIALHQIEVPESLVSHELEHIKKTNQEWSPEEAEKEAKKRISMGLLLRKVVMDKQLRVDADKVREHIERMAATYHDPEQMVRWYYEDKKRLQEIEAIVLEHQAIDTLIETMQVEERLIPYDQVQQID